jgi:hypothetical protein
VTSTRITVQDTTGRLLGVTPTRALTPAGAPDMTTTRVTIRDTSDRVSGVAPASESGDRATSRVTIRDTSNRLSGVTSPSEPTSVTTTPVTIRDTTGRLLGVSPVFRGSGVPLSDMGAARITADRGFSVGPIDQTRGRVSVEEVSTAVGPAGAVAPFTIPAGSGARRTLTITSDAPIDTPIVILSP